MRLPDVEKEVNRFNRGQKILIVVICISLFLGLVTVIGGNKTTSTPGYDAFSLLRYSLIEHPSEVVTGWFKDLAHLRGVQEENEELKHIIASQNMYKAELDEKSLQLQELEELMDVASTASYHKVYASLINRDMNTWSNTITLNKGSKDGIKVDMAVVSSKGLLGKVSEVNKNTCKVKLLSTEKKDISVAIKIHLKKGKTTAGILEYYNAEEGRYNVQIFDANVKVEKGMKVVTSGIGGVFPSGILVGEVEEVTRLYNSKGRIVTVVPSVDFNDFNYVAILAVD